jgi:hypothetical protein
MAPPTGSWLRSGQPVTLVPSQRDAWGCPSILVSSRPLAFSGVGYTYLNPHTGHELSAVAGFTYSGMNDALQYRNGIDFHFDWAVSQFVSKSVHVGIAGYVYQQVTGDSGAGATLGDFMGHSIGIGPQIGIFFPAFEGYTGYLNIRGYWDLVTENRPTTQFAMVTLSFAPAAPEKPATPRGPRHLK